MQGFVHTSHAVRACTQTDKCFLCGSRGSSPFGMDDVLLVGIILSNVRFWQLYVFFVWLFIVFLKIMNRLYAVKLC